MVFEVIEESLTFVRKKKVGETTRVFCALIKAFLFNKLIGFNVLEGMIGDKYLSIENFPN